MNYYRFLEELVSNETATSNHGDEETLPHSNTAGDKPWRDSLGAAMPIQMVTLSGSIVVSFGSCFQASSSDNNNKDWKLWLMEILTPSFAAGKLLATAVFLIIPEAIELLSGDERHSKHHEEGTHLNGTTMGEAVNEGDEFGSSAQEAHHPKRCGVEIRRMHNLWLLFRVPLGAMFHPSDHHSTLRCLYTTQDLPLLRPIPPYLLVLNSASRNLIEVDWSPPCNGKKSIVSAF